MVSTVVLQGPLMTYASQPRTLRWQALGHMMERHGSPIRWAKSISMIAAWWLPGLREKGRNDMAAAWRLADIHTPSVEDLPTLLPHLQVTGGRRVGWAERMDSWRPRLVQKVEISAFWMSPFMSAIRMIWSPSNCQVEIVMPRSWRNAALGWQTE